MIALLQRVTQASVAVDNVTIGAIGKGLLVLLCAERNDTTKEAEAIVIKLLSYRVFADQAGKMNRSLIDISGALLLVPQFTLAADTRSGTRPSFSPAALPEIGQQLFEHAVAKAKAMHATVETGKFGADMQVSLVNNGPVTFWLQIKPQASTQV